MTLRPMAKAELETDVEQLADLLENLVPQVIITHH